MTDLTALTEALYDWRAFFGSNATSVPEPVPEAIRRLWQRDAEIFAAEHVAPLIAEREARAWDAGLLAGNAYRSGFDVLGNPYRSAVSGEPPVEAFGSSVTDAILTAEDSQPDPDAEARAENAHALHRWKPSLGICDCGWALTQGKSHLAHVNEKITAARRSGSGTP